jgi:DNA-binding LytR/AlgR family response regulator
VGVIADDEPLLRRELRAQLASLWPELTVIAEASDGRAAVDACRRYRADVAFLDIRMPRLDGLAAATELRGIAHVVFLTAYDNHAVDAFGSAAIDYLVKPVQRDRLRDSIKRLQGALELQRRACAQPVEHSLTTTPSPPLRVTSGRVTRWLSAEEIVCFQAIPGYTQVVTREAQYLIRTSVASLARTYSAQFVRTHRAVLVQRAQVAALRRLPDGQTVVDLHNGLALPVSRARRRLFRGTDTHSAGMLWAPSIALPKRR